MASEIEKIKSMDEEAVLNYLKHILELETVIAELSNRYEKDINYIQNDLYFFRDVPITDAEDGWLDERENRYLKNILKNVRTELAVTYKKATFDYSSMEERLKHMDKYLYDKFKHLDPTPVDNPNHFSEDALDLYKNLNLREEAKYNARDYPVDTEWTYNIGPNTYYKYNYMDICRIGYIVRSESIEIENTINTIRDKYLNPLYDIGIIHPKYRNLIAIASFVDYFETGRVEKLKGSDGAYNLFEQELRANIIISELKKINESLEIIKSNQYALYTELKEVRKITEQIGEEQRKRAKEVSTFNDCMKKMVGSVMKNSEITARCTKTIKYLAILNAVL